MESKFYKKGELKDKEIVAALKQAAVDYENGEIAEEGSHAELLAKKGVFYRLYMLQSEANKKIIAGM